MKQCESDAFIIQFTEGIMRLSCGYHLWANYIPKTSSPEAYALEKLLLMRRPSLQ